MRARAGHEARQHGTLRPEIIPGNQAFNVRLDTVYRQVFARFKALLRKAAARTVDALREAISNALNAFPPQECSNYLNPLHFKCESTYRRSPG